METKEYVLKVTIRTDPEFGEHAEEQSLEITLRGKGYDPRTYNPYRCEVAVFLKQSRLYLFLVLRGANAAFVRGSFAVREPNPGFAVR